jgi:CheY-like chemotaxis protein
MEPINILVADDGLAAREVLTRALVSLGYDVTAVEDGNRALLELEKRYFHFALLDWVMPGMNGLDLCRFIRNLDNPRYTYVILTTAKNDKQDLLMGLASGADEYLNKPIDKTELQMRLKTGRRIIDLHEKLNEEQRKNRRVRKTDGTACP